MAEIRFLPVCSNCNRIIYETIDFEAAPYFGNKIKYIAAIPPYISPNDCPYCGEHFERVFMATELPFEPDKYDKILSMTERFNEQQEKQNDR